MQDLVHMMTQTLKMDIGDSVNVMDKGRLGSTAMPEFKLNKKYRDTLVLHGKAREEAEHLSLGEIPIGKTLWSVLTVISMPILDLPVFYQLLSLSQQGSTSGPAKIRRAIEQLRTDVVKGLGVKLLDKVLEIMEEEDDNKREVGLLSETHQTKLVLYPCSNYSLHLVSAQQDQ